MLEVLIVWGFIFGYIGIATILTPIFYKRLRGNVYNYRGNISDKMARERAYMFAWFWPVGIFLFIAWNSMKRVDERAELDKKERAELEKLRAAAAKEVDSW